MQVSVGLAQMLQPKVDELQAALTTEGQAGVPLAPESETFEKLERFAGDLMNANIAYYRDDNPFGITSRQLFTLSEARDDIGKEITRVKQGGNASPERILDALSDVESILPPTQLPVTEASSATGATPSGSTAAGQAVSGASSGGSVQPTAETGASQAGTESDAPVSNATVNELLEAAIQSDSSDDKYTLIKAALILMGGGEAPAGAESQGAGMSADAGATPLGDTVSGAEAAGGAAPDAGPASDAAPGAEPGGNATETTGEANASNGSGSVSSANAPGAAVNSEAFNNLLSSLSDLADLIQNMSGISDLLKGQLLDQIASILLTIQTQQTASDQGAQSQSATPGATEAPADGGVEAPAGQPLVPGGDAVVDTLSAFLDDVQNSLPEGQAKQTIMNLLAAVVQALVDGSNSSALTPGLNAVMNSAQATGNQAIIDEVNELAGLVNSASTSSGT